MEWAFLAGTASDLVIWGFSAVDSLHRQNFLHSAALRDLRVTSAESPGLIGAYSVGLHWEFPGSTFSGLEEPAGTRNCRLTKYTRLSNMSAPKF